MTAAVSRDQTEHADETTRPARPLAAVSYLDPADAVTDRAADLEPTAPRSVVEAIEALHDAHPGEGRYPDHLVDALIKLVENAAEQVAEHVAAQTRLTYSRRFRRMARSGSALTDPVIGGLHLAAVDLEENRAALHSGDTPA